MVRVLWQKGLRIHHLVKVFRKIIVSFHFHFLLRSNLQSRSIRLTNPKVVNHSLITCHSSRMPPQLFLAGIENFRKNRVGFGTLHGREHLTTM